ncbi:hypothetical protein DYB37_007573 [Aphanomyces astaci]|uniref:Uncharacterized protein n=2 Tax=Aphanomyces astaci TaxID=112090 RepID=A0A397B175_APHAT|nr:hypothetical protein DYB36_003577 [Aphanomyces astaci]RHY12128.1 hypothetical protein DYB25_000242 [Aphanomyces astaci]RHY37884.1 hypothetical protein DYB38_003152 [Aphanomyces astaci]RHY41222.1 hypothetical protein DYB30_003159 [Aphanomyces astaci]RHY95638.1 hypothetical protein DYB35_000300 [Aphanomyces astaci]
MLKLLHTKSEVESCISCIPLPVVCDACTASPSETELEFLVHQVNQLPTDALEEMIYIVSAYEPQWLDVLERSVDSNFDVTTLSPLAIEVMQHYVYTNLACCFVANMDNNHTSNDDDMDVGA